MPEQQIDQYKKLTNVNQGGTFALANGGANGNNSARTSATALQDQYLNDKFARDAEQNYQNNVAGAGQQIEGELGQAANANTQNSSQVLGALSNLYNSPAMNKPGLWGSIFGALGGIGSSIINKF